LWLQDSIGCLGSELTIESCEFDGWGITDCNRNYEAIWVKCAESLMLTVADLAGNSVLVTNTTDGSANTISMSAQLPEFSASFFDPFVDHPRIVAMQSVNILALQFSHFTDLFCPFSYLPIDMLDIFYLFICCFLFCFHVYFFSTVEPRCTASVRYHSYSIYQCGTNDCWN
jgi:hypothetical protein